MLKVGDQVEVVTKVAHWGNWNWVESMDKTIGKTFIVEKLIDDYSYDDFADFAGKEGNHYTVKLSNKFKYPIESLRLLRKDKPQTPYRRIVL